MKDEMRKLFAEEFEKIAMEELKSTSAVFQKHVKNLKCSNEELQKKCEEHEQYGRPLCLRIKGLAEKKNKRICKWCINSGTWSF